ncbi:MAG: VWA domain-containing protein [Planctomycetia bacterium]|nr:VWA domain-containing protein [Planctomycetia bacterium]
MTALEKARLWWQRTTGEEETPLDGDTPAWVMSMLVHVAVLLALSAVVVRPDRPPAPPITILQTPADPNELVEEVLPPEELVVAPPDDAAGARSADSVATAESLAPVLAESADVPVDATELFEGDIHVDLPEVDVVPVGLTLSDSVVVRGDVAVGTAGASGAVDRLTAEIRASLEQRPTIVCWVFDQSISLAAQRQEIADRLGRVFDELGANGSAAHRPELLNMVFAYGERVTPVVVKPTRECAEVVRAIESIPIDDSGKEMTFTALADAAKAAKVARINPLERNVMIVAFTDEVGNDQQYADQVATFCRAQAMRIYVVGVPAPFGRRQVEVRFVEFDPAYAADDQFAVVDQGPETLHPEVVRIRSARSVEEPMDSGFGPYSLSKVCAETGGIYFCVHANRRTDGRVMETAPMASRLRYFFDGDVMRAYRPDYLPAAKVDQLIAANRAKKALVEAARSSIVSPLEEPETVFPREDDGQLANLLGEAQKAAAVLAPKIDALHGILVAGQGDRDKLGAKENRWQAGYDLAMGRILAAKVRIDAYNIMLAQAKSGMKFKNPRSDTWRLERSDTVSNVGSQTEKLATQARTYLDRVVTQHPGTPWALIAAEELRTPLGYEWREDYTGVMARKMGDGNGNGNPADDKKRDNLRRKPKRDLKNL